MSKWIKYSERLPNEKELKKYKSVFEGCFLVIHDGDLAIGNFIIPREKNTDGKNYIGYWAGNSKMITHWMSLPEPPKE